MTDKGSIIVMLSSANEEFNVRNSGQHDWEIECKNRDISFYFDKDGKFKFLCNNKR